MKYTLNEAERLAVADALDVAYDTHEWPHAPEVISRLKALFEEPHPPKPLWQSAPFTDVDRANMLDMMTDETRDSVQTLAREALDDIIDMAELVSYADMDPQETAGLLDAVMEEHACFEDYETSEHHSHVQAASFMRRMGLVDPDGRPTPVGIKYLTEYK